MSRRNGSAMVILFCNKPGFSTSANMSDCNFAELHKGHDRLVENLWHEFFSAPSQWWDHRPEKRSARYPDFKHKKDQKALWLNCKSNPPWVETRLASLAAGIVPLNSFPWNVKLSRYVKAGQFRKTLQLFQQMQQKGVIPDKFTYVPILNACANLRALEEGRCIHAQVSQNGYESDVFVGCTLVNMYAKCGSIDDACAVFQKMPTHNVVSWNTLILGHVKCGQAQKAIELYQQMQHEGFKPDPFTFVGLLNACASLMALEEGRQAHKKIIQNGFESDGFVGSSLVDMYAKCGSIEDAWTVFRILHAPDVVTWNAIILGYVKCGQGQKALELFHKMQQKGVEPDNVTFLGIIKACAEKGSLDEGRHLHAHIIELGYSSNIFVSNSLIDMYANCGSLEDGWRVFDQMPTHDLVSWNVMILGFVKCGQLQRALELFEEMKCERIKPDPATFVGLLNACASVAALEEGKYLHEQVISSALESDVLVGSSLIGMYAKCGRLRDAQKVFDMMPTHDVVCWNALIQGLAKCEQGHKALDLFQQMQRSQVEPDPVTFVGLLNACASSGALEEGRFFHEQVVKRAYDSDTYVCNCLVDMYAKCGNIEEASRVFDKMQTRDVVSWNTMILGHVKCGQGKRALELCQKMQLEEVMPDSVTLVGYLNACASEVALDEGRLAHQLIIKMGLEFDIFVGSSLIDMYAKCGSIKEASKVLHGMPVRDLVSWNAMLGGYAMHGLAQEALGHFQQMCQGGVHINTVTFVSLLSACSHAGLVDEGLLFFESISPIYNISATVDHYACIFDLLGRAGRLHEAQDLINKMSCKPDVTVWISLLSACRDHGNVEIGECAAKQIIKLDPENSARHVLLSNIYAAAGEWNSSSAVQLQSLQGFSKPIQTGLD